jgi:Tetratricopeptide repeat.
VRGSPLEQELASVGRLLSQGAESLSRTLASLAQGRAVRGGRSARGVQQIPVLRPDLSETALLEETTVTLQWESVEGATRYMVVLRRRDTGETLLEEELPETQTQFQLRSLAPGSEYELILSAPRGERATLKTEIRFRIMSEKQREELRWARQNASKAPLVAGLLLHQLERYREAIDALQRAQQLYPDDEAISRALQNLRARTRQ